MVAGEHDVCIHPLADRKQQAEEMLEGAPAGCSSQGYTHPHESHFPKFLPFYKNNVTFWGGANIQPSLWG